MGCNPWSILGSAQNIKLLAGYGSVSVSGQKLEDWTTNPVGSGWILTWYNFGSWGIPQWIGWRQNVHYLKPHIQSENPWFPVDFPFNQSIESPSFKQTHPLPRVVTAAAELRSSRTRSSAGNSLNSCHSSLCKNFRKNVTFSPVELEYDVSDFLGK